MMQHGSSVPEPFGNDPWLAPYAGSISERRKLIAEKCRELCGHFSVAGIAKWSQAHKEMGLHHVSGGKWIYRDWAPNASAAWLIGDFSGWQRLPEWQLHKQDDGIWCGSWDNGSLAAGMNYLVSFDWPGGGGNRVPAWAEYTVQDPETLLFCACIPEEKIFKFRYSSPVLNEPVLIYEAHVGMASEEGKVASFTEFTRDILPRIAAGGYNTVQLMGIMNHPYYGSFGYHVANFFSISSRFGTPEEFKLLVDTAHKLNLRVIIDLVHSHAVKNEAEGLACYDGTRYQFFHDGSRGEHSSWDSLCFDYSKKEVLRFLLSNCRWWLEEYNLDGFRFDGVTSMLYRHHGLGRCFTGYGDYFGDDVDTDSYIYLALANMVVHGFRPGAVTVAEDVSGMPGLAAPVKTGGCGFDYRMAMGVTDAWFKLFDIKDEDWSMWYIWGELTNRRRDERSISYVECHDQAIVGGQTALFRLAGRAVYDRMRLCDNDASVQRAAALCRIARLLTLAGSGHGYLNFMGNEFGHPEWIDFPRAGNNWSYHYARRQWSLADNRDLYFHYLGEFDKAMLGSVALPDVFARIPQTVNVDEEKKIIAFERGGLWFFVNLDPVHSYTDCCFEVMPGEYEIVLDSDNPCFGGLGRIQAGQRFFSVPVNGKMVISLYLPNRTAIVLKRKR